MRLRLFDLCLLLLLLLLMMVMMMMVLNYVSQICVCVCAFQVLATGLSGLYSSLPTRLQVYSEDWHCLEQADWQQVTMTTTK